MLRSSNRMGYNNIKFEKQNLIAYATTENLIYLN